MFKTKDNLKNYLKIQSYFKYSLYFSNMIIDDLNPPKLAKDVFDLISLRNNQLEQTLVKKFQ